MPRKPQTPLKTFQERADKPQIFSLLEDRYNTAQNIYRDTRREAPDIEEVLVAGDDFVGASKAYHRLKYEDEIPQPSVQPGELGQVVNAAAQVEVAYVEEPGEQITVHTS